MLNYQEMIVRAPFLSKREKVFYLNNLKPESKEEEEKIIEKLIAIYEEYGKRMEDYKAEWEKYISTKLNI